MTGTPPNVTIRHALRQKKNSTFSPNQFKSPLCKKKCAILSYWPSLGFETGYNVITKLDVPCSLNHTERYEKHLGVFREHQPARHVCQQTRGHVHLNRGVGVRSGPRQQLPLNKKHQPSRFNIHHLCITKKKK